MENSLPQTRQSRPVVSTRRVLLPLLGLGLGFGLSVSSNSQATSGNTQDQSLMRIERVDARLELIAPLVTQGAATASRSAVRNVAELEPLLQKAAVASFDPTSMKGSIVEALRKTEAVEVNPAAFAKAAQVFCDAAQKLSEANPAQGKAFAAQLKTRLADRQEGPRIVALAEAMASSELAVETAFTGQVMYAALEALTNSSTAELRALSPDVLESQLTEVVERLRDRSSNEKPVPKDVAAAQEKHHLSLILATIPQEDLAVLHNFYTAEKGKAKRDALVAAYRHASNDGNHDLLSEYSRALLAHVKHAQPSQQN